MIDFFSEKPWACNCGCGFDDIDFELVQRLNIARWHAGIPFVVTSACRCPRHNKKVGGVIDSDHLRGTAADVQAMLHTDRYLIVKGLIEAGLYVVGINLKKHYIHTALGDPNWPIIFTY